MYGDRQKVRLSGEEVKTEDTFHDAHIHINLYGSHSLYLSLQDFCIDMPDDGLRKGRNMEHTRKGAT